MSFTPFQHHLEKAVQRLPVQASLRAISVCTAYRNVAGKLFGEDIVAHMKPTYQGGVLTITTTHSALLSELRLHKQEILAELTRLLGKGSPAEIRLLGR